MKAVPGMAAKPVEAKTCGHGDGGAPSGGMHDAVYVSCSSSSGVDSASDSDSRNGMVTVHAESGCGGGMIGSKRKVGTAATAPSGMSSASVDSDDAFSLGLNFGDSDDEGNTFNDGDHDNCGVGEADGRSKKRQKASAKVMRDTSTNSDDDFVSD